MRMQSRITFLERGEMEGLFDDLSMMLGISIEHILIEAEKNIGKAFYASTPLRLLKYAPHNPRWRPEWVAKTAIKAVRGDVAGLGGGLISAVSYDGRGSMVLRISNPVFISRTIGNAVGIYESIERVHGATYDYFMEDGDLVLMMRHPAVGLEPEPLSETRLLLDEIVPGNGPVNYERCARCGTPHDASRALEWNLAEGTITNRLTGKREVVGAVQSVNAMMRELVAELGEEILKPLYECQKEITRQQLERDTTESGKGFWDRFLLACAVKGLGYPLSIDVGDDTVSVEIANAYEQTLYAARIAAAFEHESERMSSIDWDMRRGDMCAFRISAAS